jgi:proteasome alpha subunit
LSPLPYYVSPEQMMKDRADYARKGIARGRSLVAIECADGILLAAENPSMTLHKVSEIYDRIAFAAVGKYNEFENFRVAGVRLADLRGFSYGREDVTAKMVANAYAQALGAIFTQEMKPYEVELLVAQASDELYRIQYDGSVTDEQGYVAIGGQSDALAGTLGESYRPELTFTDALKLAARALELADPTRPLDASKLEIAVLDRTRVRRAFRRISASDVASMLGA